MQEQQLKSNEVRALYLKFFEDKGHKVMPSISLIPHGDPTLLLTSAGMVPFKDYFAGRLEPPSRRMVSCQKCFRTTDIEEVGDATHLTFFEMLGNFSIGDYFKKEAITWAWEFITEYLELPVERLWVNIFLDDNEAYDCWREVGVASDRINRLGEEDNFWGPAGNSGPCGPDTEIFYDFGKEFGCDKPSCAPGCDCARFTEIWNLVFTQFNQDEEGNRTPLPSRNIDTGMGLERVVTILQGKSSIYETDLFIPLMERVQELCGKRYGENESNDHAMKIVAEHGRAVAFLIADGVMPGNEGRGYVLRRLLRRATLFGLRLGLDKPFLGEIAVVAAQQMGGLYPEVKDRLEFVTRVIELEETRFSDTLKTGLEVLEGSLNYRERHKGIITEFDTFIRDLRPSSENAAAVLEQHGFTGGSWGSASGQGEEMASDIISTLTYNMLQSWEEEEDFIDTQDVLDELMIWTNQLSGKEAFRLYDTYGLPVELTKEVAVENGLSVDLEGFEREMEVQRERAKNAHRFDISAEELAAVEGLVSVRATPFVGYDKLEHKTHIIGLLSNNTSVEILSEGDKGSVILESTPFYGEMGGQVGDSGEIHGDSARFKVNDTVRLTPDIIIHNGYVVEGTLDTGEEVEASVNEGRRLDIARNHTATHLLQAALREVLGDEVQQRGSLVEPDRLRFDFSYLTTVLPEELRQVQSIVNERIRQNLPVASEEMPYKEAIQQGAIALFDEKYGETVRVVRSGEPAVSTELCGGTHVSATGQTGTFLILSEGSIGSGLRRIEAVTGRAAEQLIERRLSGLENISRTVTASLDDVAEKVAELVAELDSEQKRNLSLEREMSRMVAEELLAHVEKVNGVTILAVEVRSFPQQVLREMSDFIRDRLKSAIVVMGTVHNDRPAFLAAVTPDLVEKGYNAGDIVRKVAKVTGGGGGGGSPTMAQAGGKDKQKLGEALQLVRKLIEHSGG